MNEEKKNIVNMNEEKKILLDKIGYLIDKRKLELVKELPDVHEINDSIVIRFFAEWDNCHDDKKIKFKKIVNHDNPNESIVFFFIPKDSYFELKQRFYVECITCLNGLIEITYNNKNQTLKSYSRICPNSDDIQGKAFENTYLIITSDKMNWFNKVHDYVKTITS